MSLNLNAAIDLALTPEKVLRSAQRADKRSLSKAGAFVRRRARTQYLRRRKRVSKPGQGPSVHSKDPYATLKNIRFLVNRDHTEVVIGPLKFFRNSRAKTVNNTVPGILEFGGSVVYARKLRSGKTVSKIIRIRPRPFMGKAYKDVLPQFAELWKDQVRP